MHMRGLLWVPVAATVDVTTTLRDVGYANGGSGRCYVSKVPARNCSRALCAGLLASAAAEHWTMHDVYGEILCAAYEDDAARACGCRAPPLDTAERLKAATAYASYIFYGDSTTRNALGPIQELLLLGAAGNASTLGAAYYEEAIVGATRAALAAARAEGARSNGSRPSLARAYPGNTDRDYDANFTKRFPPRKRIAEVRHVSGAVMPPVSKHRVNNNLLVIRSSPASAAMDAASYDGFAAANASNVNHRRVDDHVLWPDAAPLRRVWVLNYGLHALHAFPGRRVNPTDANYAAEIVDAFHAIVRRALNKRTLDSTILVWRSTNFVCDRNLFGAWDAAIKSLSSSVLRAGAVANCTAEMRPAWDAVPKRWGAFALDDFCAYATMDARGSRFINAAAANAIRRLNDCYVGGTASDGFPCPADLRGVYAQNASSWPLPGIRILRADSVSREFCGVVPSDAVHAPHAHPILARLLFGVVGFAPIPPGPTKRNFTCRGCGIRKVHFAGHRHELPAPDGAALPAPGVTVVVALLVSLWSLA